ncbi:MAG: tRNA (cytidine(34)-2'-O)-methyltransferase [Coriobacteriales bacterium]|nr:tRNA (cytidine(34)-2'-O)-methyltransferase [Coriobacteriales bacterium]
MLNVVLVEPEIPANTGNIGRTCVLTGTRLHLVGPMGFDLSDKAVQRAGLAYWQSLDLHTYRSWEEFVARNFPSGLTRGVHLLTKAGERLYSDSSYADGDWLVFGKESEGLSKGLLDAHPSLCERIPMLSDDALANKRDWHSTYEQLHPELRRDICGNFVDERTGWITSLNLSNAVAIVLYEALRQQGFVGFP